MYEILFSAINIAVFPAWFLLIFVPGWRWTGPVVHTALVPLALGAVYLSFLTLGIVFGQSDPEAGMSSLAAVQALFSHPVGLLTGWVHFLAFDLFVGAWISRDARRRGVARALVLPSLILAFLFGPTGLLLYLVGRKLTGKAGWSLDEGTQGVT
ncbi:ABA4-like family protein [Maricaulis sp.]|uniref:ABA4-like family protein n=1 Tax=Maricaulis sp. TaxID=1486257 RepID=UPI003A91BBD7